MRTCIFKDTMPANNRMCNACSLFLNTYYPNDFRKRFSKGSELDCFLCEGCNQEHCVYFEK